ncbi:YqgQ family protein [Virgibacillus xinjiangensis]|uniref:YqgQ family protein n=1 Tax=Virgibacillus xinjiangensis TaxID=393090 RepID=A0ABV7CRL7_9BACI
METILEVQKLLRKYGAFIYTGNRLGDLQLMEMELDELHHWLFISNMEYLQAKLIIKREITSIKETNQRGVSDE